MKAKEEKTKKTPRKATKRAAIHERNARALLEAAEAEFSSKGYERAGMAVIAATAGIAIGSMYRIYPGKRELGAAVMERIAAERAQRMRDEAMPAARDFSRDEALRVLVGIRVSHHVRHGAFVRMGFELQRSLGRRDPPESIRALFDEARALTREFFAVGAGRGFWRNLPPAALARAFDGICTEETVAWERSGREGGEDALASSILATVGTLFAR